MASMFLLRQSSTYSSLTRCFSTTPISKSSLVPASVYTRTPALASKPRPASSSKTTFNPSTTPAPPSTPSTPSTPFTLPKSSKLLTIKELAERWPKIPPYPYGPALIYKQSDLGLYGGAMVRFGNKVSEKNEIKTRRRWDPNTQNMRLYSEILEGWLDIRLTTRVARTIKKVGGLDKYLLGTKTARIKELGIFGWKLRYWVLKAVPEHQMSKWRMEALMKASARKENGEEKKEAQVTEKAKKVEWETVDEDWEFQEYKARMASRRKQLPEEEKVLALEEKEKLFAIEGPEGIEGPEDIESGKN